MNAAHFHLLFNHLPIISTILGILILSLGYILSSAIIKRTALFIFILGSLFTFPAFNTGEGAEEVIENMEGISEDFIKIHEELAETFAVFAYLLGAFSTLGIWISWKQKTYSDAFNYLIIAFSIVTLYFGAKAGTSGGEIRHTEIRTKNSYDSTKTNLEEAKKHSDEADED